VACQKISPSAKEQSYLNRYWIDKRCEGVVHGIIYAKGSKLPELPVAVIGTFEHYTGPRWKGMEKEVPIGLVSSKFFCSGKDGTWRMLPMLLGYALSVNKLQGICAWSAFSWRHQSPEL
jgi:hypothetical protein